MARIFRRRFVRQCGGIQSRRRCAIPRGAVASRDVVSVGCGPDGLGAVLSQAGRPPIFGTLDPEALAGLQGSLPAALGARGLVVPGEDAALSAAERRLGRALADLLHGPGMREIAARLDRRWAAAREAGMSTDLLLDLRASALWGLPWELVELLPLGEPMGGSRVARLVDGPARAPVSGVGLDVAIWSPTPDDPDCSEVIAELRATLAACPGLREVALEERSLAPRVVHVVSHGGDRGEPALELGDARSLDAATASRVLEPLIRGAALVVLDVCGSGAAQDPEAMPAWRVVNTGAAACLAPRTSLDVEASIALSRALYGALSSGASLVEAVQAGRRAVAALGLPDPSARWWTPALVTSDAGALDLRPVRPEALAVPGVARAAPDAADVLVRAAELARTQGFFGIEHIALALTRAPDPPTLVLLAQPQLLRYAARAAGIVSTGAALPRVTPRLETLLGGLGDGFDRADLLRAMAATRPILVEAPALRAMAAEGGLRGETFSGEAIITLPGRPDTGPDVRGLSLEVLGGPEDGRICVLDGERPCLGRWDPEGEQPDTVTLFAGAGAVDPAVSRRHLRWDGGHGVEALAPTRLRRAGDLRPVGGTTALRPGDVLEIGQVTRLEVVRVAS